MGKRSSTLALACLQLTQTGVAQSPEDIRKGMMVSQRPNGTIYDLPAGLRLARDKWVMLQIRQLQRLALESLLSWSETKILSGVRDTADLIAGFASEWDASEYPFRASDHLSDALASVEAPFSNLDEYIACCRNGTVPSPLALVAAIQKAFAANEGKYAAHCFFALLLCAALAGSADPSLLGLRLGGSSRISLFHLRKRLTGLGDAPIRQAMTYVLEALVISQHFATAVNRFDGQNQRLRIAIEENGVVSLVGSRWEPTVTEDRLPMLLSLAADCSVLRTDGQGRYLSG
jgi:hypothetical protein